MVKRVLVFNGSKSVSVIPGLLASAGYEVTEVFEAENGLSRLDSHLHDLIVTLESADAESWVLCRKIRSITNSPIIVISSGASTENCVKAINAGADFFIRKPFGPMELMARINALFQRMPSRQPVPLVS